MERETTTFTIDTHTFTAKTYATARESHLIRQAYFKGARVEMVGQEPKISEFNPVVQYEVSLELIRQIVTEMDGEKNNIVDRCEQLPQDLFDQLVAHLDDLIGKKKS